MAKYGGFFLQGLSSGLQTGFQIGQQAKEWKWQKEQKEKIQKEKDDIAEAASIFNKKIEDYYADGTLSDDEKLQLNTAYLASAYNVQEVIQGSYDAIMKMDKDTLENNLNWFKFYKESIGDFDPSDIPGLYEFTKGQMIGEKGKQMFVAGDNLLKKQYEAKQKQKPEVFNSPEELLKVHPNSSYTYSADAGGYIPTFTRPTEPTKAGISDYNSAATYLSKFVNAPPETFNKVLAGLQKQFPDIDMSSITQESLREPEKVSTLTANQFFKTPDEVISKSPKVEGYRIDPTLDKEKGWYANYTSEPKGEKPNPNSYLFGKKDLYGNVQSMGIIPYATQMNISSGIPLTEDQKKEIINNHNIQKSLLDEESLKQVELILKQLEINLEETAPIPEPIPEPTPGPGPIQKVINWFKEPLIKPKEAITPIQGIPTPTLSTEQKESLITSLTDEELYNKLRSLDPADPMYKFLYAEAQRRGLK